MIIFTLRISFPVHGDGKIGKGRRRRRFFWERNPPTTPLFSMNDVRREVVGINQTDNPKVERKDVDLSALFASEKSLISVSQEYIQYSTQARIL